MTRVNVMTRWCVWVLIVGAVSQADADVRLPKVFGDQMLLQRGLEAPVWG